MGVVGAVGLVALVGAAVAALMGDEEWRMIGSMTQGPRARTRPRPKARTGRRRLE